MADYYTIQRRRNLIVGIFVVLGLCAFFFLVMIMGDLPVAVSKITSFPIQVQFPETPGITKQSPVQYCGYQIGKVAEMIPPQPRENPITKKIYNQTVAVLAIEKNMFKKQKLVLEDLLLYCLLVLEELELMLTHQKLVS